MFSCPSIYLTVHFTLEEVHFQSNMEPAWSCRLDLCVRAAGHPPTHPAIAVPGAAPGPWLGPGSRGSCVTCRAHVPGGGVWLYAIPGLHGRRCQTPVTAVMTLSPSHPGLFLHHNRLKIKFKSIPSFCRWDEGVMYRPVALNTSFFLIHIKMNVTI